MNADNAQPSHSYNLRKKRKSDEYANDSESEVEMDVDKEEPAQSSSVATSTEQPAKPKRRRTNAGVLAELLSLDLDILYEVLARLSPPDLLNVMRVNKAFRALLLNRDSASVWIAVLGCIEGLPEAPIDMQDLPAYASFIFDQFCTNCLAYVRTIDFKLRSKLCRRCAHNAIDGEFFWGTERFRNDPICFQDLIPTRPGPKELHHKFAYVKADYDRVKAEYAELPNADAREAYVKERKEYVARLREHAARCIAWADSQKTDRTREIDNGRTERKNEIIRRLTELGWGDEINSIKSPDSFNEHKLVKQNQPVTDRVWSHIQAPMVKFMEEMKEKRLKREFDALVITRQKPAISVLRQYKKNHSDDDDIMPEPVDFVVFPPIKAVLERPREEEITESSFDGVLPELPTLIDQWRASINRELLKVYQGVLSKYNSRDPFWPAKQSGLTDAERQQLSLATTVFSCTDCEREYQRLIGNYHPSGPKRPQPLWYPWVLGHRCLTHTDRWGDSFKNNPARHLEPNGHRTTWSSRQLEVSKGLSRAAGDVVAAFGKDASRVTAKEMDESEDRLACFLCHSESVYEENGKEGPAYMMKTFGWRSAVQHKVKCHPNSDPNWVVLTPVCSIYGQVGEMFLCIENLVKEQFTNLFRFNCVLCRDLPCEKAPMTYEAIVKHMREVHKYSKRDATKARDKDYVVDYAAPQVYPSFKHSCLSYGAIFFKFDENYFSAEEGIEKKPPEMISWTAIEEVSRTGDRWTVKLTSSDDDDAGGDNEAANKPAETPAQPNEETSADASGSST